MSRIDADWLSRLELATTTAEAVRIAADYVRAWTPVDLLTLPAECRPGEIADPDDVVGYAYRLVSAHCAARSPPSDDDPLPRMAAFFARAAQRLVMLSSMVPQRPARHLFQGVRERG
jgi:hypothetical protein